LMIYAELGLIQPKRSLISFLQDVSQLTKSACSKHKAMSEESDIIDLQ